MTTIAQRRSLSAIVGAAGLCLLAACAGNQGAQAISTESGNTSPSSTWEGSGSSSSASTSSSSKPAKARNQLAEFRSNPTPELDTLSERNDDIVNRSVVVTDTNLRMLREDWGRLWFWERPSRMSPTSIPH